MTITKGAIVLLFIGMCSTVTEAFPGQSTVPSASIGTPLPLNGLFKQSVNMKLLVLSADGKEPSFAAITFFLDHLGIPYDAVVLTKTPLPSLSGAFQGFYQGIVLATGNLSFNDGTSWMSALSADGWANIEAYQRDYGVRVVSYFTYPDARYGLALAGNGVAYMPDAPGKLGLTPMGSTLFPYLIPANQIDVVNAFHYPAATIAAEGETTTPIINIAAPGASEQTTAGVTHVAADGRESLALTVDSART